MANNAFDFAKKNIAGGNNPRPDDILKALLPRYKRFREFFGDYIIDKVFAQGGKK